MVLLSRYLYICTVSKVIELYITSQLLRETSLLEWETEFGLGRKKKRQIPLQPHICIFQGDYITLHDLF